MLPIMKFSEHDVDEMQKHPWSLLLAMAVVLGIAALISCFFN
mgnify:FL=1|jgi:hypothetical protein